MWNRNAILYVVNYETLYIQRYWASIEADEANASVNFMGMLAILDFWDDGKRTHCDRSLGICLCELPTLATPLMLGTQNKKDDIFTKKMWQKLIVLSLFYLQTVCNRINTSLIKHQTLIYYLIDGWWICYTAVVQEWEPSAAASRLKRSASQVLLLLHTAGWEKNGNSSA